MIISHKYKFIFIRPIKVASTSVELNLSKHCGEQDIIASESEFNPDWDEHEFIQISRNSKGFDQHFGAEEIKNKIGEEIWTNYFKFSIVRNPWDLMISKYWFNHARINSKGKVDKIEVLKEHFQRKSLIKLFIRKFLSWNYQLMKVFKVDDFEAFITNMHINMLNEHFLFDEKGNPSCDFYIRYENLDDDYKKVCELIGIPYQPLSKTKTKIRKSKEHYSTYYNEKNRSKIARKFKRTIDHFGYIFEDKRDNIS